MSFSLFGEQTKNAEVSLILDIGSASVAGALVLFEKRKQPRVLYITRIPITVSDSPEEHDFTKSMLSFVKRAIEDVSIKGIQHLNFRKLSKKDIRRVFCIYASPWFASETKTINIKNSEPKKITKKMVEDLVNKEKSLLTKNLGISDESSVIEQKIISTKLNGYLTSNPYDKEVLDVEMTIFLGVVPTNIIDSIENAVRSVLHPDDIVHHSFSLVAYRTITDVFQADSNSIVLDVTGEVTDITVIEDDVIVHTASVPFGRNTLVRAIAREKKANSDIALSLLHLYSNDRAESKLYTEIDAIVADVHQKWKKETEKILPDLSGKTIFVTTDEDLAPIFKKYITYNDPNKVIILNEEHFKSLVTTEKNIKGDSFVSTAALFLDGIFQHEK